ncbi:hypothetical protein AAVH_07253 [Aphelenchoides avenae]|nr:hypothetical protein AAVH_07253 [Aphelenchus avenae]
MDSAHPKGQFPMPRSVMLKHPRILWKRGESSKPSDEVGKMQRSNDEDAPSSGGELAELRQLSQRLEKERDSLRADLQMREGQLAQEKFRASQMREEAIELETEASNLTARVGKLKTAVQAEQTETRALRNELGELKEKVAALTQKLALETGGRELKQKVLMEQVQHLKAELAYLTVPTKRLEDRLDKTEFALFETKKATLVSERKLEECKMETAELRNQMAGWATSSDAVARVWVSSRVHRFRQKAPGSMLSHSSTSGGRAVKRRSLPPSDAYDMTALIMALPSKHPRIEYTR